MSKLRKIKGHLVKGTILNRVRYQFSGLKKWEDFKKSEHEFLIYKLNSKTKLKLYKNSYLSYLIIRGDFEPEEINFFNRYVQPVDTIMDIGGNIGLFTCLAASKAKAVYTFEPTPAIFSRLQENVELNNYKNCHLFNKALSAESGSLVLNVSTNGMDAWNTLGNVEESKDFEKVTVETIALDDFFDLNKWQPDSIQLIKMDVEGWEMNVLNGAKKVLNHASAPDILIEVTDENLVRNGVDGNRILSFLLQCGYELYEMKKGKLHRHTIRKAYEYCNIFCSKNSQRLKERKFL